MATVLIVDDDPELLDSLRAGLERAGFRVLTAADGAVGAQYLRHDQVDAVVTDIFMPDHGGVEEMMGTFLGPGGPAVILMSGGGPQMDERQAIGAGARFFADAWLYKPFRKHRLLALLDRLLGTESIGPAPDDAS